MTVSRYTDTLTTMNRLHVVGPSALTLSGANRVSGPLAAVFLYFLS